MNLKQQGINKIEIAIIVAAIGILLAVAFPVYQSHTLKPKFSEVMSTLGPYKFAIEACAKEGTCVVEGKLSGLAAGKFGIPPSVSTTYLANIAVASDGTITATATNAGGLAGETFVLTPTFVPGAPMSWAGTGTCKTRPAGAIC